jgi:hypothetical protein
LIATLLEGRDEQLPGGAALNSLVVQSAGMATWSMALHSL